MDQTIHPRYGFVQCIQVRERRGNKIYSGGYGITYDREGREVCRTPIEYYSSMTCPTEEMARDYCGETRAPRLIDRILGWFK